MNFVNSQQQLTNQQFSLDQICQQHGGQPITHMCCLENCLTPLCGKCIKEHTLFHKQDNIFAEIETIDDIDQFCDQKLSSSTLNYNKELDELQQQLYQQGKSPQERQKQLENLKQFRKKLLEQLNQYFDEIENNFDNIEQQISIQQTLKQHENQLKIQIKKLQNIQETFDNKQNLQKMSLMKQILTADYDETLKFYQSQKDNYLNQYQKENFKNELYLDQHPKERLKEFLKQLAFFRQTDKLPQYYQSYKNTPDKINANNNNNENKKYDTIIPPIQQLNLNLDENKQIQKANNTQFSPENIINTEQTNDQFVSPYLTPDMSEVPQQQQQQQNVNNFNQNFGQKDLLQVPSQTNTSNINAQFDKENKNQLVDYQVTMNDYFNNSQGNFNKNFLHFFQHKSKNLHLVNLLDLHKGLTPKFYQMELQISFKIPRWHKSYTLPDGNIVLTGGVSCEVKDQKLKNCYILDFQQSTLKPIKSMNLARSGHAITYLRGELYVIGGFSELQTFTTRCEKYNFQENKWTDIAELNQRANNPCVCSFNDQFIFKFGGKFDDFILNKLLERYDVQTNEWQIIKFQSQISPSLTLLTSSCCTQINDKQIMIFGGTFENYSQKSDSCYLLDIQNSQVTLDQYSYSIKGFGEKNLTAKDGFWNNQCIIFDKNVYCLQNISNDDQNSVVYLDRRRILKFNSHFWTSLNDYQIQGSGLSSQREQYDTPQQQQNYQQQQQQQTIYQDNNNNFNKNNQNNFAKSQYQYQENDQNNRYQNGNLSNFRSQQPIFSSNNNQQQQYNFNYKN